MPLPGGEWVDVGCQADFPPGEVRRVGVRGRILALVHVGGVIYAVDAKCPHQGGPLDEGRVWDGKLECPWHHFLYDPVTGANIYPTNVYPADMPQLQSQVMRLELFPVWVEGDRVLVKLGDLADR